MAGVDTHWEDLIKNSITDNFCSEALVDIVMRLPVKSIGRFRCVCKSWNRSFTNPDFIKRHMHRSTFKTGDSVLLERDEREIRGTFCMRDNGSLEVIERLKFPIEKFSRNFDIDVVDCSEGLICLADVRYEFRSLAYITIFWNPVMKEYKAVPACRAHTDYSGYELVAWGFAYEDSTDDYKFVRVLQSHEKTCEAEVYSLNRKSWTRFGVGIIWSSIQGGLTPAVTNGTIHWMAKEESGENFILTYDVMNDTMGKIILSADIHKYDTEANMKYLSLYGGQLCVIVQRLNAMMNDCDVWVMKEYGVPTTWSKLDTVISPGEIIVKTLGVLERGELVAKVYGFEQLILLCNFVTKDVKTVPVAGRTCVIKYRESLVSLKEEQIRLYEPVPAITGEEA